MKNIKRREFVKEIGMGATGVLVLGGANNAWANTGVAPCYPGGFTCIVAIKWEEQLYWAGTLNIKKKHF